MKDSISFGQILGFPVKMHLSTLALLAMLALVIGFGQGEMYGLPVGFERLDIEPWAKALMGCVCAVLLFLSILLHEIAHGVIARGNGQEVRGITLLFFGGMVDIDEESPYVMKKGDEMMAFAGPASNLAVGLVLIIGSILLDTTSNELWVQILVTMLGVLGFYNALLALFNLLPGYPMDGGLILRSYLRKRMEPERVTRVSIQLCRVCSYLLGFVGIWEKNMALFLIALLLYLSTHLEDPDYNYHPRQYA